MRLFLRRVRTVALTALPALFILGGASSALALCPPIYVENFDTVVPPVLPGWDASQGVNVTGAPIWGTSLILPSSPPNDAFSFAPDNILDNKLDTPVIFAGVYDTSCGFRHSYNFENGFDGGVLEISTPNINGGAFTDVTDPVFDIQFGGQGYNGTISTAFQSPIAGRPAFTGNSNGYTWTMLYLGFLKTTPYQEVILRFRLATDNSVSSGGWRIDSFFWNHNECPPPSPPPVPTPTPTPTPCPANWSDGPSLPTPVSRASGVYFSTNGRFYVIGGNSSGTVGSELTHPLEYNPATSAWVTKAATFPDNQVNDMACGALIDNQPAIYCVGGSATGATTATSRVFRYDPVTDAISSITPWPGNPGGDTLPGGYTVLQNKLYLIGGYQINTAMTNQIWEFTPLINQWVQRNVFLPVPLGYVPATTIGNLIYLAGGSTFIAPGVLASSTHAYFYNPDANAIIPLPSLPKAVREARALTVNRQIWLLGGTTTAGDPSAEVNIYEPTTGLWTMGTPLAAARRHFPAAGDGVSGIWLTGGCTTDCATPLSSTELFQCEAPTPPPPTPTPTLTATPTATATFTPTATATPTPTPTSTPTIVVTNTNDSGPGSLRQAIVDAHDGDTIGFDPALNGQTIQLTHGELVIDKNVTISGPGPAVLSIGGSRFSRIFHLMHGHIATITGLTIRDGFDPTNVKGGGILNDHATLSINNCSIVENGQISTFTFSIGGGIYNDGSGGSATLTVTDCSITSNAARFGGGIYNDAEKNGNATISLGNTSVSGNIAAYNNYPFPGGGSGGGIVNNGNMTLTNCTVNYNQAGVPEPFPQGDGGGISNGGSLTIMDSTISHNSCPVSGGGISNWGTLSLSSSTINNNSSLGAHDGEGWGYGGGIANLGTANVSNSTITSNSTALTGGGIHNGGTLVVSNSTLNNNNATESGGGVYNATGRTFEIGNTILKAGNVGSSIFDNGGTVISHGYNLSNDNGGGLLTGLGDQINTEPLLGSLQNNGGPTFTHSLQPGSPAINAGDPKFTPPPLYDQRGFGYLRLYDGRLDIGSFEAQPVGTVSPTPTATVTPTAPAAQLANISTRLRVETGDGVGISGFIINGAGSLQVAIRGLGPSLGQLGLPGFLPDPILEVRDATGGLLIQNDNWQDDPQATQLIQLGLAPGDPLESALIVALPPGPYTAIAAGANGGTGIGLVEVYNVDQSVPPGNIELANISTRGFVQTGNNVMIGGFILTGGSSENAQIVVRGIGPSLTQFGIPNVLTDPTLELRDSNGALLIANDNWQDDPASAAQLTAHGLAPSDPNESGIYISLQPSLYTAILAGKNGGTGVGLVEIYNLN